MLIAHKGVQTVDLTDESEIVINEYRNSGYDFADKIPVEITAKIAELELAEPLRLLREQRNQILSATDWQASSDLTMSAEQTAYRQALRDLPANSTPALDENGQLIGVVWPTEPV